MSVPDLRFNTPNSMQDTGRGQKSNWLVACSNWADLLNTDVMGAYFRSNNKHLIKLQRISIQGTSETLWSSSKCTHQDPIPRTIDSLGLHAAPGNCIFKTLQGNLVGTKGCKSLKHPPIEHCQTCLPSTVNRLVYIPISNMG